MRWYFDAPDGPESIARSLVEQAGHQIADSPEQADVVVPRSATSQIEATLDRLAKSGWVPPSWPPMEHSLRRNWKPPTAGIGADPWGKPVVARASGRQGRVFVGVVESPDERGERSSFATVQEADDWRLIPADVVAAMRAR